MNGETQEHTFEVLNAPNQLSTEWIALEDEAIELEEQMAEDSEDGED